MCVGWSIAGIMSIHKWQRNRNVRRRLQNDTICAVSSTENRTSVVAPPSIGTVPSEITMETTQYNPPHLNQMILMFQMILYLLIVKHHSMPTIWDITI